MIAFVFCSTHTHTQRKLINLTNTKFTKEQINTLALGSNYALEKDPKHYINENGKRH